MKSQSEFTLTVSRIVLPVCIWGAACSSPTSENPNPTLSNDASTNDSGSETGPSVDGAASTDSAVDGGVETDGGKSQQEQDYCAASASHNTCPGNTAKPCNDQARCIYGTVASPAAAAAYNACYSSPSCKGDDACAYQAGTAVGGAAATTYVSACAAKVGSCPGVATDYCSPAVYMYPLVITAINACLSKTCGELVTCFKAALTPVSDCKK